MRGIKALRLIFFLLIISSRVSGNCERKTSSGISGFISSLGEGERVVLNVFKYGYSLRYLFIESDTIVTHGGVFTFSIRAESEPVQVEVCFPTQMNSDFSQYPLFPNDSIVIRKEGKLVNFTGRGSNRWRAIYDIRQYDAGRRRSAPLDIGDLKKVYGFFLLLDSIRNEVHEFLKSKYGMLSQEERSSILSEFDFEHECEKRGHVLFSILAKKGSSNNNNDSTIAIRELFKCYFDSCYRYIVLKIPSRDLRWSFYYPSFMIDKFTVDSCILTGEAFSLTRCYNFLESQVSEVLRDRIMTELLYSYRTSGYEEWGLLIRRASNEAVQADFKKAMGNMRNSLASGARAYDFELADTNGRIYTYKDFKGKVLVLDFWFTGCGNCARLLPFLMKIESKFRDSAVVFLSINVDEQRSMWLASIRKHKYTTPFGVNLNTMGRGLQDPLLKHYYISSFPTVLLIGMDGKLCSTPMDARGDDGESLVREITRALRLRQSN